MVHHSSLSVSSAGDGGSRQLPTRQPQLRLSSLPAAKSAESRVIGDGGLIADALHMLKCFVYVLKNTESPSRYYTGITSDVSRRCAEHNAGTCIHTAKYRPWSIDVVVEFADERRAVAFERYLKSGSGVAFAMRHLR